MSAASEKLNQLHQLVSIVQAQRLESTSTVQGETSALSERTAAISETILVPRQKQSQQWQASSKIADLIHMANTGMGNSDAEDPSERLLTASITDC